MVILCLLQGNYVVITYCCYVAVHVAIEEGDPEEAVVEEEVSEGPGKTCSCHYNLDEFQASEALLSLLQTTS